MTKLADSTLSSEQWQALGRLADRYQRIEEVGQFVTREFGGTATERVLELAELLQDPRLANTLREGLETMAVLAESGVLEKLRELSLFVSESETYMDTDGLVEPLIRNLGKLPVAQLAAAWRDVNIGTAGSKPGGGWSGLLKVMRDPDVQTGLLVMGRFLNAFQTTAVKSGKHA
jgi:uncharacterized protein YjgD (DUF1641 family)